MTYAFRTLRERAEAAVLRGGRVLAVTQRALVQHQMALERMRSSEDRFAKFRA